LTASTATPPTPTPTATRPDLADEVWYDADAGPVVRLYALTRGRVAVDAGYLDVASVVTAGPAPTGLEDLSPEQAEILRVCVRPVSVAEVAAHLGLPLSTARVLLSDLRANGLLVTGAERPPEEPSVHLLGKVLAGLSEL
jgi:DNA-binding transcriptional ArsR family regulator